MENEKIAENILRDKCRCAKQKALSGVNHICFVCEFTKALNAKDAEIARLENKITNYEILTGKDFIGNDLNYTTNKIVKLEAQVAKYRKALQPFVDNYDRYGNNASFSHGLFIKAKQALEEWK